MNKETLLKLIILFSFLGILVSAYLVYLHYRPFDSSNPAICDFNNLFNCSTVNQSPYSTLFSIPVSLFGVLSFFVVITLSFILLKNNMRFRKLLLLILIFNMVFSLYLLLILIFMIKAVCIFCLILDTIILLSLIIYLFYLKMNIQDPINEREKSIEDALKRQKRKKIKNWSIFGVIILIILALIIVKVVNNANYIDPGTPKPILGNPDAKVILIEFGDLQCPACSLSHPEVKQIIKDYSDKIKYEFHHFPLVNIHKYAYKASQAAECANDQGKFYEYIDIAYSNQKSLSTNSLKKYALSLNLDTISFNNCLDSGAKKDEINRDLNEALSLRLKGTPTFLVNGKEVQRQIGLSLYESLQKVIESELK